MFLCHVPFKHTAIFCHNTMLTPGSHSHKVTSFYQVQDSLRPVFWRGIFTNQDKIKNISDGFSRWDNDPAHHSLDFTSAPWRILYYLECSDKARTHTTHNSFFLPLICMSNDHVHSLCLHIYIFVCMHTCLGYDCKYIYLVYLHKILTSTDILKNNDHLIL